MKISKGLIAFIVVACLTLAVTLYLGMRDAAREARQEQDDILKNFKTIDNDLKRSLKDTLHATGR